MKTISPALRTHLDGTVTSVATIWKLTRKDGEIFYFTDHDVDIVFDDGAGVATYLSDGGYDRTAIVNHAGLRVDNMDMSGFLNINGLKFVDIQSGRVDYAEVLISLVNWADLTQGSMILRKGHLGEVQTSHNGVYSAELRGMTSSLSQMVVEQYQPECRVDLGSPECGVPLDPALLGRNEVVALGDVRKVVTKSTTGISWGNIINNPIFEHGDPTVDANVSKWTMVSGVWDITETAAGLPPFIGSHFLIGGTSASGEMYQIVPLTNHGVDLASIDAGNVTSDFSIQRANNFADDTGRVLVEFLDSSDAVISTMYDSGYETITPLDTWFSRSASSVAVPANTRGIKVSLFHTRVTGSVSNSGFDNLSFTFDDSVTVNTFQDIYENRIYTATVAGTTAGTQPTYDTIVGNSTVDGTATFIASESWTRDGTIVDAEDFSYISIDTVDSRATTGWFSGGALTFESGLNTGIAQEVKIWVTGGAAALYLPSAFDMASGTKVSLFPGCDKRVETCLSRFDNVINFRGEPFVPGEDLLTQINPVV